MFERYTEKARRAIFFARYEASQFGSTEIDTDHLLLGLLRENSSLLSWVPKATVEVVRERIEVHLPKHDPVSTSVDLPLSEGAKDVLKSAATEADGLAHKYIGTEHLFLALLNADSSPTARLLIEYGANAATMRARLSEPTQEQQSSKLKGPIPRLVARRRGTVEIHGLAWNADYVRDVIALLREHNWHWHKTAWVPRDVVIERTTGRASFDMSLVSDSINFELVKAGWKKDHCSICRWELSESEDDHGTGYTNGQAWLCVECYERFYRRPDYFSSSHSDIT